MHKKPNNKCNTKRRIPWLAEFVGTHSAFRWDNDEDACVGGQNHVLGPWLSDSNVNQNNNMYVNIFLKT